MSPLLKRALPLLIALSLLIPVGIYFAVKKTPTPKPETPPTSPALSVLGKPPDWKSLEAFQNTITREDFEHLLTTIFTVGEAWRDLIEIDETSARIRIGKPHDPEIFHLRFATPALTNATPRNWKSAADLPPPPPGNRWTVSTSPSTPATSAASGRKSRNAGSRSARKSPSPKVT